MHNPLHFVVNKTSAVCVCVFVCFDWVRNRLLILKGNHETTEQMCMCIRDAFTPGMDLLKGLFDLNGDVALYQSVS